jgi:DNA polymerase-1
MSDTLATHLKGTYQAPGHNIIHSEYYPESFEDIKAMLETLKQYPKLTCDIETFSLKFWETGIATIGFAWDKHNGTSFCVDTNRFGQVSWIRNLAIHQLLREFFETYTGTLIWHSANFDLKIIVNTLWMDSLLDERGKQHGIEVMTKNFDDTKLITYLATNSTAGNNLSLKDQAQEFAGNYAMSDINDITQIPTSDLLRYNLVDCLSTWHVYEKHYPTMVADQQKDIYERLFLPSVKLILQMELTGMPLDMDAVIAAEKELGDIQTKCLNFIHDSQLVKDAELRLTKDAWAKDYADRKSKAKNPDKIQPKDWDDYLANKYVTFNPNSNQQVQTLIYEIMGLPVIDLTDGKDPAVGGKTLKKLKNHTTNTDYHELIDALRDYYDVSKILDTFIKAFKESSVQKEDGWHYLHGNFNLGGTVSGRLSSSGPNLQNLPSNSRFAKVVKKCFKAPPGWLFCGADFASLEDRISALTTKDPNKIRVYTDGFDGHCLRAFYYFGEQMPDIKETVESINSIEEHYKALRQDSKGPTFALTYQGTWITLVNNLGWPEDKAKQVEARYHEMYKVSDEWVQSKLQQASKDGYVEVAFGLRVRTPLLKQVILNQRNTPYEAQAEGRTAGNALGQSWGLLNNRAGIELQERTFMSMHRYDIKPVAHIHDAQYFLVKDDLDVVHWLNDNIVECMAWQDHPDIYHPKVKLGGELGIFYPDWSNEVTLPNFATPQEILNICKAA